MPDDGSKEPKHVAQYCIAIAQKTVKTVVLEVYT